MSTSVGQQPGTAAGTGIGVAGGAEQAKSNPCPELQASWVSRLFFLWNDELIRKGYSQPLQCEDVWDIRADMSTRATPAALDLERQFT